MHILKRSSVCLSIFALISALCGPLYLSTVFADTDPCSTSVLGKSNAELQADLDACNAEIDKWTQILNETKKNTASYANEVAQLTAKINAAQANIKAKTVAIANLTSNITQKEKAISTLESQIDADTNSIAELLRKTKEVDSFTLAETVLSDQDLSEFFSDVDAYSSTRASLLNVMDNLRGVKTQTESEKQKLAEQRDAESAAKAQIEAAKKQVEAAQAEQKTLLAQSQNQEKAYGQVIADKKAKAEAIKTALFGLRDSVAIPFSLALQYAQEAGKATGVRPALILGILRQESNLGANVGSCVITDLQSGQTRGVTGRLNGVIFTNGINPTRDLPYVQSIIGGLGRDPLSTRVSCPVSSTFGYGGAMGPAQFIPSTWNLLLSTLQSLTGKSVPDPWSPADAIMAAAVQLKNNGAATQIYINERTAACRYYSGKNCYTSSGAPGTGLSYGNSVMNYATQYQSDIDFLQGD